MTLSIILLADALLFRPLTEIILMAEAISNTLQLLRDLMSLFT
jgi:hypothetical protein